MKRLVALTLWLALPTYAASGPGPFSTLLSASLDYHYVSTEADTEPGATYTRTYAQPASLKTELGFLPMKHLYVGFVFDLWKAGRAFNNGSERSDLLDYQVVAMELGYITGNPRSFFIVSGMIGYPLKLSITASDGTIYTPATRAPLTYGGRVVLGLRFVSWLAVLMEAGYRLRNLGVFSSAGTPYLSSNAAMDFSGLYISTGVGFTL